jgi:hypothetical protein
MSSENIASASDDDGVVGWKPPSRSENQIFGDVRVGGVVAFLALFVVAREEVVDGEVDIEVGALQLAYYQVPALALEDDLGLRDEFLWDVGRRHSHHGAAAARAAGADDDRGAATTYPTNKKIPICIFLIATTSGPESE